MSLPHLHLYHPPDAYILEWIAEVEECLRSDADWDGCQLFRTAYDSQAGFNVGTETDRVRRNPGPVIFIQKVQRRLYDQFQHIVLREVAVYSILPGNSADLLAACEEARRGYEDGEPRIPLREFTAYLILAKLKRQDKWGGTSLNKNFLWASDLPKGGFPKDIVDDREVLQVADALFNAGVLTRKKSQGKMKYGLGDKAVVEQILESKAFDNVPTLRSYFDRSRSQVSSRHMTFNES